MSPIARPPSVVLLLMAYHGGHLSAPAQSVVSGPISGAVFDAPSRSARAVVGMLGSASLGLPLSGHLDFASISPAGHAIGFRDDQCLVVSGLRSGELKEIALPGCTDEVAEAVAWSPDGSVAILRKGNWFQPISGLPKSPRAGIRSVLDAPVLSAIATGRDGSKKLIGVGGVRPGIYQVGDAGDLTLLFQIPLPKLLTSNAAGDAIYAWDELSQSVYVWRPNFGEPEIHPLSPFKDPVALQWALDDAGNQVLYVAGKKDRMLAVYDASRFELLSRVELTFEPTTVEPLGGGAYLLAPRPADGEPFWAFTNHGELKVHFVPAPPIAVGQFRTTEASSQ